MTDIERRLAATDLRTECQTCGGWAVFAGRSHVSGGRTYAVAYCPQCDVDIPFWTPEVEARIAACERAQALRCIAERLCTVATGGEQEIRDALAMPTAPPPLGARECEITAGLPSLASVRLCFSRPMLVRTDLDRVFGHAEALPRTGAYASHKIVYGVQLPGAPACISLFASFHSSPEWMSAPKEILLRIDPA